MKNPVKWLIKCFARIKKNYVTHFQNQRCINSYCVAMLQAGQGSEEVDGQAVQGSGEVPVTQRPPLPPILPM